MEPSKCVRLGVQLAEDILTICVMLGFDPKLTHPDPQDHKGGVTENGHHDGFLVGKIRIHAPERRYAVGRRPYLTSPLPQNM